MSIVYDLFLNFQEVAFDFFEWAKQDNIDHIKKIPLVRVNRETLYDLIYKNVQVSGEFLKDIYNLTSKYDLNTLEYACLFSDGRMAIALEFREDGISICKSRLLLEDEEEVGRYVLKEKEMNLSYQILEDRTSNTFFTRKEWKIRNFLEREIISSYQKREKSKIEYLYLEYFDEVEQDLKVMKERLLDSMKCSLNKKHLDLYELLLLLTKKKTV